MRSPTSRAARDALATPAHFDRLGRSVRGVMQVMEFAHGCDAAQHHLQERHARRMIQIPSGDSRLAAWYMLSRQVQKESLWRGAVFGAAAQHALKGVRVAVHQAWKNRPASSVVVRSGKSSGAEENRVMRPRGIRKHRQPGSELSAGVNQVRQPAVSVSGVVQADQRSARQTRSSRETQAFERPGAVLANLGQQPPSKSPASRVAVFRRT